MELENSIKLSERPFSLSRIISGTALIAGTAIGAGMLGIPLVTAQAGFIPSLFTSVLAWLFMLCTGLLLMETALSMPPGANILTLSRSLLGRKGQAAAGGMFLFLYYCLLVAYFAGGAPLFSALINRCFGIEISGILSYAIFGGIFLSIVALGAKSISRVNLILTVAMFTAYGALVGTGSSEVKISFLQRGDWSAFYLAFPLLFSAFGYHNVIPSLCQYLERDRKSIRLSIITGTALALVFYLVWQWLIIGSVPQGVIEKTLQAGQPVTQALAVIAQKSWIFAIGQFFAFFALITSLLGVAFSMVDFLADGLKVQRTTLSRWALALLTFVPPAICALVNPAIFEMALGVAGGVGEAFLNGFLPVMLVWVVRYVRRSPVERALPGGKGVLVALLGFSLFVMGLEAYLLIKS